MDIEQIRALGEIMSAHDLSRIEIHEGETLILLRRGQPLMSSAGAIALPAMTAAASVPAAATGPAKGAGAAPTIAEASAADEKEQLIRSPMVGTFYSSAEPDAPPFVRVGTRVHPDSVVCLVEAMKVFNEIKAEVAGTITKVLVKNAQAVEFDQPLFAVSRE